MCGQAEITQLMHFAKNKMNTTGLLLSQGRERQPHTVWIRVVALIDQGDSLNIPPIASSFRYGCRAQSMDGGWHIKPQLINNGKTGSGGRLQVHA